jgi:hypothetical protein
MESVNPANITREPWNKGKLVGQKTPFKLKEIWAIRVRLQIARRCRDFLLPMQKLPKRDGPRPLILCALIQLTKHGSISL